MFLVALLVTTAVVSLAGCRCSTEPKEGEKDVRKACEVRTEWRHHIRRTCTTCLALAAAPPCGCATDSAEYAGLCSTPQKARIDEPSCRDPTVCANACRWGDCDCIERCYESNELCRKLASAVDACLAEVCDPHCR